MGVRASVRELLISEILHQSASFRLSRLPLGGAAGPRAETRFFVLKYRQETIFQDIIRVEGTAE